MARQTDATARRSHSAYGQWPKMNTYSLPGSVAIRCGRPPETCLLLGLICSIDEQPSVDRFRGGLVLVQSHLFMDHVCMRVLNWKILTALLLFPAVYFWCGIQIPLGGAVAFATHMAEEGQHCDDSCPHPSPLLQKQPEPNFTALLRDTSFLEIPFVVLLSPHHLPREHPLPLSYSLSHGLRAPPALIPT